MRTIRKYPIRETLGVCFTLELPTNFYIVKLDLQNNKPILWIEVDTEEKVEVVTFYIFGTGWEIPKDTDCTGWYHIDTYFKGPFDWHLYVYWEDK